MQHSTHTVTVEVTGWPADFTTLPQSVQVELVARIAYASQFHFGQPTEDQYPTTINIYVDDSNPTNTWQPEEPYDGDYFELPHLGIPANGSGMYGSKPGPGPNAPRQTDARWFIIGCNWDNEDASTICRDFNGNLMHYM